MTFSLNKNRSSACFSDIRYTLPRRPSAVVVLVARAMNPPTTDIAPLKIETSKNPPYLLSSAPLTGGPIKAAREATPIPVPKYVPIVRGSGITIENAAEEPEMIVPDQNPKAIEYTI